MRYFRSVVNPNNLLLVFLVLIIFFVPVLPVRSHFYVYNVLFSFILLASVFSLQTRKKKIIFLSSVALVILEWIAIETIHPALMLFSRILQGLFFIFIAYRLVRQTATAPNVTMRVIADSISGYLLVGVMYAIIIFAIFRLQPDALRFPDEIIAIEHTKERMSDIFYYTFVTYTTMGYGDILPATPGIKALATLISATGQLYIAIIIALLVGKFASGVKE